MELVHDSGTEAAFAEIVERHKNLVYGVCRRMLADPADVEDAVQAVFLITLKKGLSIPEEAAMASWMFRTAEWVCRSSMARRTTRTRYETKAAMARSTVVDPRSSKDLSADLDPCLASLPKKERDTLVLRYLQGMSLEEVAKKMACPVRTVESRRTRALQALRKKLQERGVWVTIPALLFFLTEESVMACPETIASSIHTVCTGKGTVSTNVNQLMESVMSEMSKGVGKWVTVVAIALLAVIGLGFAKANTVNGAEQEPKIVPVEVAKEVPKVDPAAQAIRPTEDPKSAKPERVAKKVEPEPVKLTDGEEQLRRIVAAFADSIYEIWAETHEGTQTETKLNLSVTDAGGKATEYKLQVLLRSFADHAHYKFTFAGLDLHYHNQKDGQYLHYPKGKVHAKISERKARGSMGEMLKASAQQEFIRQFEIESSKIKTLPDTDETGQKELNLITKDGGTAKILYRVADDLPVKISTKTKTTVQTYQIEYKARGVPTRFKAMARPEQDDKSEKFEFEGKLEWSSLGLVKGVEFKGNGKFGDAKVGVTWSERRDPQKAPSETDEVVFKAPEGSKELKEFGAVLAAMGQDVLKKDIQSYYVFMGLQAGVVHQWVTITEETENGEVRKIKMTPDPKSKEDPAEK